MAILSYSQGRPEEIDGGLLHLQVDERECRERSDIDQSEIEKQLREAAE